MMGRSHLHDNEFEQAQMVCFVAGILLKLWGVFISSSSSSRRFCKCLQGVRGMEG